MRTERELLIDVLGRLNQAGTKYMLTGSMGSNYWGIPRTTHDLDFVVVLDPDEVDQFVAAFSTGFFIQPESVRSAFQRPHQFNIIDEQSALKADFWMLRDDVYERNAFDRRLSVEIFGVPAWIATPEDIILHKLYWNRITPSMRQLVDSAGVFAVQTETLDIPYLRHWADHLQVRDTLESLLSGKLKPKST